MKNNGFKRIIGLTALVALTVASLMLSSCEPEGMSIDERIDAFMSDLNAGSSVKDHFADVSSSSISSTTLVGTGQPFDFDAYAPFAWTEISNTSDTRTGTISRTSGVPAAVIFVMKKETLTGLLGGEDWKILTISVDGDVIP